MRFLIALLLMPALALANVGSFLEKPDAWFRSDEGREVVERVLSWQSQHGGWPKNQDNTRKKFDGKRSEIRGTFDNGATTGELRLLARAFDATRDSRCRDAFNKGFDHILEAQYPNGGWPQYHPPGNGYARHITYNDAAMVRLLEFLRETRGFRVLDRVRRRKADEAFERGVDCIVRCQIVIDGEPTVWCAQHDPETLAPEMGRSYELPSLSGSESAGILRFLMTLEAPPAEVVRAVKAGAAWFESAKIEGIRIESSGGDRRVVEDRSAKPLWARFYDLETGEPFFCERDGVKRPTLAEIGKERRNGYAWYGSWGESVARDFAKWPHR